MIRPTLLRVLSTLALLAVMVAAPGHAAEVLLWPGGLQPPQPISTPEPPCAEPTGRLSLRLWELVRQEGGPDLTCGNAFVAFDRTPRSDRVPEDAFQVAADQIRAAHAEVLLASMEWRSGGENPGMTFARAVRDLYVRVAANPAAYPQGMSVRLLLGGLPDFVRPDGATQILSVAHDLRSVGVPLSDPRAGWTVTLLNYRYLPHSHVKLHVIDGTDLTVAGYNYTDWHLPVSEPGGRALHDLGLHMSGPVAQSGVAVFDDLWRRSQELVCPADVAPDDVTARCALQEPAPPSHPELARHAVRTGDTRAYMLYRRTGVDQADVAHLALLDGARTQVDLMQADFGPPLTCWYAYLNPSTCPVREWTTYMTEVLTALRRGVHVRLLLVDYGIGAAPNRSGVALIRRELHRRGLDDRFEARYTTFTMHTKALTVDHELVVTGSMNFHFASWGSLGLAEAALATDDPRAVAEQEASFNDVWANGSRPVPEERWLPNVTQDLLN
ncbi:phosphatidylserine/phosphatidylglycerophosphate/cardiolipin synthase-like enzyme [Deinococcus metalli]|uniref:Phosphatidylserine/phosphatidylglycerophosphate/ cardiolipin synthase-like enzyme n=1 Tax=Deinococcus metalli TaxID=1141878 RepID=A0A7W8KEK7_9DEIO|nr:phospholipase D-like domain-containing protein [Deinococcus metalli]MBB5375586.1 phosphatidylserine/phosphatidylglycerophosphate/cardiolipin synthase-like enzyme [Deinococcus metalli]GHF28161.1 phospholipase [Deinococcus metalli]